MGESISLSPAVAFRSRVYHVEEEEDGRWKGNPLVREHLVLSVHFHIMLKANDSPNECVTIISTEINLYTLPLSQKRKHRVLELMTLRLISTSN